MLVIIKFEGHDCCPNHKLKHWAFQFGPQTHSPGPSHYPHAYLNLPPKSQLHFILSLNSISQLHFTTPFNPSLSS